MLSVIYAVCHLCCVLCAECHYTECHLCSLSFMLSVIYAVCNILALYAECHYAECRYAEC
jgi:hypothetical protein